MGGWIGDRREAARTLAGALGIAALPAWAGFGAVETAAKKTNAKKKQRKRRQKDCKKSARNCDQACNLLPHEDHDWCKDDCKIAKKPCKKAC